MLSSGNGLIIVQMSQPCCCLCHYHGETDMISLSSLIFTSKRIALL